MAAAANQVDGEAGDQAEEDQTGDDVVGAGDVEASEDGTGVRQLGGGLVVEGEGVPADDVAVFVVGDDHASVFTFGDVVVVERELNFDFAGLGVDVVTVNHDGGFIAVFIDKDGVAVLIVNLDIAVVNVVRGVNGDNGVTIFVGAAVADDGRLVAEGDGVFVGRATGGAGRGGEDEVTVAVLTEVEVKLVSAVRLGWIV